MKRCVIVFMLSVVSSSDAAEQNRSTGQSSVQLGNKPCWEELQKRLAAFIRLSAIGKDENIKRMGHVQYTQEKTTTLSCLCSGQELVAECNCIDREHGIKHNQEKIYQAYIKHTLFNGDGVLQGTQREVLAHPEKVFEFLKLAHDRQIKEQGHQMIVAAPPVAAAQPFSAPPVAAGKSRINRRMA